ncbi:MAG: hypothetical protein WBL06_08750 [Pseudolysinimonas sp.]|uniref:hypothetical protein n=1 Tax=Pseudolysinimonas sp. TaxID=2680009 RepID=UPI003C7933A7
MLIAPPPTPGPFPPSFPPEGDDSVGDWLWSLGANVWTFVTDQSNALVALAAIVTALIAGFALRATARDSQERSRPIVLASFRMAAHNDRAFDLVLHNYGASAASTISVRFDPDFTEEQKADRLTGILAERYAVPVPLLPPGSEIKNLWWTWRPGDSGSGGSQNALSTPDQVTVTVTYKGSRIRRYRETISLDTRWMKTGTESVSSTSNPGRMKTIAEGIRDLAREARSTRLLVRDIAEVMEGDGEQGEAGSLTDLPSAVAESRGDFAALGARIGVSEAQAEAIAAALVPEELQPKTGDIDVIGSGGQIEPTR